MYTINKSAPVHNSILVTDYLTKMGTKTVPHPPESPDLVPFDFWLLPKLRDCRYETIEEMKETVRNVIDRHTIGLPWGLRGVVETIQVHCSRRELLGRGLELMCVLSIKVPIRKNLETYLMILVSLQITVTGMLDCHLRAATPFDLKLPISDPIFFVWC